jgi:FKBP-type peptidyl-prolyl cis-trans isomerase FklB
MKLANVLASLLLIVFLISCQSNEKRYEKEELQTQKQKASYSIGQDIGKNMKLQKIDIEPELFLQGMKDAYNDTSLFTDEEIGEILIAFQKEQKEKADAERTVVASKNKEEGEKFLEENKTKDGVVTLTSGLQYKVIKEGNGANPKSTDKVSVHYKGTFIDGTEFDSSIKRGQPATFGVSGVIKGWTEALQLMKVGSKWELYIPSELAYGERGSGASIGPNAVLIFEVELLEIK